MVFLTPALSAPQQLPCRTYFCRDSIPSGDRLRSVQSFSKPHAFLFKQRKPDRNYKSLGREGDGGRGVWDPPERAPSCPPPALRSALSEHPAPLQSTAPCPRRPPTSPG